MTTALVSALSGRAVRRDVAMTGEISLRGNVLAIGGLKEKTMAALTYGVRDVLIPEDNMRELHELDKAVIEGLNFIPCRKIDDVLRNALCPALKASTEGVKSENKSDFVAPHIHAEHSIPARADKK
jgi:ATP-dependent Lon protease